MKTYTAHQYYLAFGYRRQPYPADWPRPESDLILCTCVRNNLNFGFPDSGKTAVFESCGNCLGYGMMPIPWSELK
jgi:hypothetical protein